MPSTHVSLLCDIREDNHREEAWVLFYNRYYAVIQHWCIRRGLAQDMAEDLIQEILIKLFEQLPKYSYDPDRGSFRGWLKTIVHNTITDHWRKSQRQPDQDAIGGTAFWERLGTLASPEAALELSSMIDDQARTTAAEVLERVRAKLKPTTWEAFHQAMVDHRPAAEIAVGLNLSVASVYKASYRVKQMLLEEYRHVDLSRRNAVPMSRSGDSSETLA